MPPSLLSLLYPLGPGGAPCPSDLLLRREVIERVGGFEEQFDVQRLYQLYEDQAFLVKLYLASPVFAAGECWSRYRIHPDSCMSLFLHDKKDISPHDRSSVTGWRGIYPNTESKTQKSGRLLMHCGRTNKGCSSGHSCTSC